MADGTLRGGRPYRVDTFHFRGCDCVEIRFSSAGLEGASPKELLALLAAQGVLRVRDARCDLSALVEADAAGYYMWVVRSRLRTPASSFVDLLVKLRKHRYPLVAHARAAECNWMRDELRRDLCTGSILIGPDGFNVCVLEVTPDGIVTHGVTRPRRRLTWKQMEKDGLVFDWPRCRAGGAPPNVRLAAPRSGPVSKADVIAIRSGCAVTFDERLHDLHLVSELGRHAKTGTEAICLEVSAGGEEAGFTFAITGASGEPLDVTPRLGLRAAVARLYEWSEECHGVPWQSLSLRVERIADAWQFRLCFGYAATAGRVAS